MLKRKGGGVVASARPKDDETAARPRVPRKAYASGRGRQGHRLPRRRRPAVRRGRSPAARRPPLRRPRLRPRGQRARRADLAPVLVLLLLQRQELLRDRPARGRLGDDPDPPRPGRRAERGDVRAAPRRRGLQLVRPRAAAVARRRRAGRVRRPRLACLLRRAGRALADASASPSARLLGRQGPTRPSGARDHLGRRARRGRSGPESGARATRARPGRLRKVSGRTRRPSTRSSAA